jgi:hypothetical protein
MINNVLTFEKEKDGCWYIVLPEWTESHASLMMVGGADTLLDFLSDGYCKVSLQVRDWWSGEDCLPVVYISERKPKGEDTFGGDYLVTGLEYKIWLCNVTKYVFGGFFPPKLYIRVSERFGGYYSKYTPIKSTTYSYDWLTGKYTEPSLFDLEDDVKDVKEPTPYWEDELDRHFENKHLEPLFTLPDDPSDPFYVLDDPFKGMNDNPVKEEII